MKAVPRALMQATSLTQRVMWCCSVLRFFMRFSSFFQYSDSHSRVAEPRRT